jgi:hypothetical protein
MTALDWYCARLWADLPPGWVFLGIASEPYADDHGRVHHRSWRERSYSWPRQAEQLVYSTLNNADRCDVYATPGLSENPLRDSQKRRSLPSRFLWCDIDHGDTGDLARVAMLVQHGSFTVASGRGVGHVHLYVRLACLLGPVDLAIWQRRLVAFVHADPSPSAVNGYLRPPGTLNHKPAVTFENGSAAHVAIGETSEGDGWPLDALDKLLPPFKITPVLPVIDDDDGKPEPLPEHLPAQVAAILADPPGWVGDRSARLFQLALACQRSGLTQCQTLTVAQSHTPSRRKYGPRLRREALRVVLKVWEER